LEGVQTQSGEAPNQQLKPKMPSLAQFMEWCVIQGFDSVQATASYYYIARHFGHWANVVQNYATRKAVYKAWRGENKMLSVTKHVEFIISGQEADVLSNICEIVRVKLSSVKSDESHSKMAASLGLKLVELQQIENFISYIFDNK
jgi:hypothetical protein